MLETYYYTSMTKSKWNLRRALLKEEEVWWATEGILLSEAPTCWNGWNHIYLNLTIEKQRDWISNYVSNIGIQLLSDFWYFYISTDLVTNVYINPTSKRIKFTSSLRKRDEVIIFHECEARGKYYCLNPESGAQGFMCYKWARETDEG